MLIVHRGHIETYSHRLKGRDLRKYTCPLGISQYMGKLEPIGQEETRTLEGIFPLLRQREADTGQSC